MYQTRSKSNSIFLCTKTVETVNRDKKKKTIIAFGHIVFVPNLLVFTKDPKNGNVDVAIFDH